MEYFNSAPEDGVAHLSARLLQELQSGKKVLWLVCGGSNIVYSVQILNNLKDANKNSDMNASHDLLSHLTIALTDERYGLIDYPESNWNQLIQQGFGVDPIANNPILIGKPLEETVASYTEKITHAFAAADIIFAQFGIGANGHIAGIMPHSPAVDSDEIVVGYDADEFTRVTLTPKAFAELDVAYALVYGDSKKEAMTNLKDEDLSIDDEPAQLLKKVPEAFVFSDQI